MNSRTPSPIPIQVRNPSRIVVPQDPVIGDVVTVRWRDAWSEDTDTPETSRDHLEVETVGLLLGNNDVVPLGEVGPDLRRLVRLRRCSQDVQASESGLMFDGGLAGMRVRCRFVTKLTSSPAWPSRRARDRDSRRRGSGSR